VFDFEFGDVEFALAAAQKTDFGLILGKAYG